MYRPDYQFQSELPEMTRNNPKQLGIESKVE